MNQFLNADLSGLLLCQTQSGSFRTAYEDVLQAAKEELTLCLEKLLTATLPGPNKESFRAVTESLSVPRSSVLTKHCY